jgi:methionyl-tRNA formyltransferase
MKIIFMGTPDFALPSFKKILTSGHHEIVATFTQKAKPKGRGMKIDSSPVQKIAEDNGIAVYSPTSLKALESYDLINSIEADIIVVVAYGFIIPQSVIDSKQYGCLNIHPSKLPKYRGAAPLQRTIINGDRETSVCIMQMDSGLDTGNIILQQDLLLDEAITLPQLHDMCAEVGGQLLLKVLDNINSLPSQPQSQDGVVYAHKLTKAESLINWQNDAFQIDCQIRGMTPWPGAYFVYEGKNIKILEAKCINKTHASQAGELINNNFEVACGTGVLQVKMLQPAGKNKMNAPDFLRGIHSSGKKIIFS